MEPRYLSILSAKSLYIEMWVYGAQQRLATGTAFLAETVRGPVLVTNLHNVTGRNHRTGELISGLTPDELVVNFPMEGLHQHLLYGRVPLYNRDVPRWYEHPVLGGRADFVIIPLHSDPGVPVFCYELGREQAEPGVAKVARDNCAVALRLNPADRVSVIGYPLSIRVEGRHPIWSSGFVASEPDLDYDGLPVFLIDCRSRQGQSGSPVVLVHNSGPVVLEGSDDLITFRGPVYRFLGIYSGRLHPDSDLGFVWKASAIRELIAWFEVNGPSAEKTGFER